MAPTSRTSTWLLDRGTRPVLRAKTPLRRCCWAASRWMAPAPVVELRLQFKERIEQAKQDWLEGRSADAGREEFIPLPER